MLSLCQFCFSKKRKKENVGQPIVLGFVCLKYCFSINHFGMCVTLCTRLPITTTIWKGCLLVKNYESSKGLNWFNKKLVKVSISSVMCTFNFTISYNTLFILLIKKATFTSIEKKANFLLLFFSWKWLIFKIFSVTLIFFLSISVIIVVVLFIFSWLVYHLFVCES